MTHDCIHCTAVTTPKRKSLVCWFFLFLNTILSFRKGGWRFLRWTIFGISIGVVVGMAFFSLGLDLQHLSSGLKGGGEKLAVLKKFFGNLGLLKEL